MHSADIASRSLSSNKKNRTSRESLDTHNKHSRQQRQNNYLLASKFGDLTQRNQTTYSRQLQSRKTKNQGDNTEYIRNLYKKYLGKQNNNTSDRKTKTDIKQRQLEKIFSQQLCRQQKLTYGEKQNDSKIMVKQKDKQNSRVKKLSSEIDKSSHKKNQLFKKFSQETHISSCQLSYPQKNTKIKEMSHQKMYNQLMDSALFGIADQKNSLVAAMGIINGIKKRYHS